MRVIKLKFVVWKQIEAVKFFFEGEVEAGHEAEEKTVQEASIVALAMWKKPHLPLQLSIRYIVTLLLSFTIISY